MKAISLVSIVLCIFYINVHSQSISLFDIDTTNFPTMKAKFYAFDTNGNLITNLSASDFELKENGLPRIVTNVSCPVPKPPLALSSVLVMDVSGSMKSGPPRIKSAKDAANAWVDGLPLGQSECALISFSDNSLILSDFTTNKQKLKNSIDNLVPTGGTDYNQALIDLPCGGLQIAKTGKHKKVLIFLTDGQPNFEPKTSEIIQFAKANNITIYAVTLDMPAPQSIKDMTIQTGGLYFENITSLKEAQDTYQKLLEVTQGGEPCEITWEIGISCIAEITKVELKLLQNGTIATASYKSLYSSVTKLELNPTFISFKNPALGVKEEKKVIVTARNANFNVTNIILNNNLYTVSPSNFTLKKNESKELIVSYTATEKGYSFCKLEFQTDLCPFTYYISGGYSGVPPTKNTLEITKPIAGDLYVVGSDTIITWTGIAESDIVNLEYSIDNGTNWNLITKTATGLKFNWKNLPKPATSNCKIRASQGTKNNIQGEPGTLQFDLSGHTSNVNHISWSPDGSRVATASYDNTGIIWDAATGNKLHTLSGHTNYVKHISWSPDGSRVTTASGDKTAIIWDAYTGINLHTLSGHTNDVSHISWSPDGSRLATASADMTANIWDANTGNKLHALIGHYDKVNRISWSPDGSKIATSSNYQIGIIWDANTGTKLHTLIGHIGYVYHISWSPDGSRVATASMDSTSIIWDANIGTKLHTLKGHTGQVYHIGWSPDGSRVATASGDKTAIIWDANTGTKLHTLSGHTSSVYLISWSPDGSRVATASYDKTGIIWDAITGTKLHTLSGHTSTVIHISWSPDGKRVATASYDKTAKIWLIDNSSSIIQEDESDVFSIVEPVAKSTDIDMGKCLVGSMKDSLVVDFVQNVGSWKFRVDSIYFSGTDANAFKLVSGIPQYVLNVGENKATEFRFTPKFVGLHSAKIHIMTQAETLEYDIIGFGEEQKIQIISDWLDFGKVEIGNENTFIDTIVIKNISNTPININNVIQLGPDKEQFEIVSGGGSFTLTKDVPHKMTIKFKPKYGGRTSGQLGFEYNGTGSPATVQLFGMGIGGNAYIANDSAFAGETKNIKLILGNIKPEGLASIAPNFEAKIRFQRTILAPSNNLDWQIINDSIYVTVKGQIGNSLELASIPLIAGLGNVEETSIDIVEMKLLDIFGNEVEYDFDLASGTFKLLGICDEGGNRLINPAKITQLMKISPNPSDGNVNIELNLVEKGTSTIKVFDLNGQLIDSTELSTTGNINIELNTQNYSNGLYFIHLQTPTVSKKEKLLIFK